MKKLLLLLACSAMQFCSRQPAYAQTFPGGIYTPLVAKNNLQTTLTAAMAAGDSSAVVASTTGWTANMYAYICDTTTVTSGIARCSGTFEVMKVTSVGSSVLLNLTRAQDGTTAIAHASGKAVINAAVSAYSNSAQTEIAAIETALGANLANIPTSPLVNTSTYNFAAQSPTTPASLTAGSRTITLPGGCPLGVNGTNAQHYLYVGNTGTPESSLITGGDCTSGATGSTHTVTLTIANSHSAGYTISSATGGLSEAEWALPATGGSLYTPAGSYTLHAPFFNRAIPMWVIGSGGESTNFRVAADFPTGATGVFNWTTNPGYPPILNAGGMRGFTVSFIQPDSTNVALYTHWPPAFYLASSRRPYFGDIWIQAAWDGFKSTSNDGLTASNITMSFFHRGFDIDGQTDTARFESIHAWPTGLTTDQDTAFLATGTANVLFYLGNVQDFKISNLASICGGGPLNAHAGTGGVPVGQISNTDADTVGGMVMSDGLIEFNNIQITLLGAVDGLTVTGGLAIVNNMTVYVNAGVTGTPVKVRIVGAGTGAAAATIPGLIWTGGAILQGAVDVNSLQATTAAPYAGNAQVMVSGVQFDKSGGTQAHVAQLAGTGTMAVSLIGNYFQATGGNNAISLADNNRHIVIGNSGNGNGYVLPGTYTNITLLANSNFLSQVNLLPDTMAVSAKFSSTNFTTNKTENYIASETGANNAITGALLDAAGVAVPLSAGLRIVVTLAHTLQAGANTMALNGGAAKNIKSSRNVANNIGTAYAATGIITLVYDGTQFVDVSQ